jgi:hypothetical protein
MHGPDGMGGQGDASPDGMGGMDLDSILSGTSPDGDTTGDLQGGLPGQGAGNPGADQSYRFAGRTWKGGQREAEGAWNKLYGQYSEQKGLVNQLREVATRNPELAAQLAASDPKMASILAKFGIEAAEQDMNGLDPRQGRQEQMSMEDIRREIGLERHQNRILREEWGFEKKLGRALTPKEQQAVYAQIERAENLTFEEAYFLAHRQQILQAQARANAGGGTPQLGQAQGGGRPKPPPRSMPGTPAPGKKSLGEMSEAEWKANLKESGIVKELLSKRG